MSEHHPQALPKGHQIEEYEIVRVLGAGGFGITYLAFDHNLDGPVALKEYFPREHAFRTRDWSVGALSADESREIFTWGRDRFIEEARAIHKVSHPNVVRVLRYLESQGTAYIVMEYVEGKSLTAVLEERRSLPAAEWRPWLEALLYGLAHVHKQGYLHRDITPANIVIRAANGKPVLIDFGAARMAAGERTHTQVLTPAYAPIEQHTSEARQGPFTDIYSLAAVSYRTLTGELPPSAPDRMLNDRYEPLAERVAGADRAWLAVIDRGMALRPEDRPQTMRFWGVHRPMRLEEERLLFAIFGGSAGDKQEAARLHKWAEKGDVRAQCSLGLRYLMRVPKDYAQAATWFRKAADQGNADAQCMLGYLYSNGIGVPHGYLYSVSTGGPQDHLRAALWFLRAARQGHAISEYGLGLKYQLGIDDLPQDSVEALRWFILAAEDGFCSDSHNRDKRPELERQMTPAQIAEAWRRARAWMEDRDRG